MATVKSIPALLDMKRYRVQSIRALLDVLAASKQNPSIRINVPGDFPITGEYFLRNIWHRGLQTKCSRGLPALSQRGGQACHDMQADARHINAYYRDRVRHPGCRNLLRNPKLKRRYPHIDNQPKSWD
ncbi:MAG: hypothetical protein PHE17_17660 [Thiothrix sp.]|uniref:hypothetical protein n=1 Tax=Thiothrix sp. TaxID=1032 RepID=UPI002624FE8F|nr:hypothetical protein [Thiothrix sp.]MDD5394848.1 hypothetical protein [Thiothrix sp.]